MPDPHAAGPRPPPPPPDPPPVPPEDAARVDGSYVTPIEVRGFHWERLRLDRGRYRYWIATDVVVRGGPKYPLEGRYSVAEDVVTLHHPEFGRMTRTFMLVNGRAVLWREDGFELWQAEHRVHPYGVLIRVPGDDPNAATPASVAVLQDAELRARLEREYQKRFQDLPEPLRTLLRANTDREDRDGAKRRAVVDAARQTLDPALFEQLLGRTGRPESRLSFDADMLLQELLAGPPWEPADPFEGNDARRRLALERVIDALPHASTSLALEAGLRAVLRGLGGGAAAISVPDTGVAFQVAWTRTEKGFKESSSMGGWLTGDPATDAAAAATLKQAIAAAQAWCRQEVDRRVPKGAGAK